MLRTRTVRIHEETYKKLKELGIMGETFDDLINRLVFKHKSDIKKNKPRWVDKI